MADDQIKRNVHGYTVYGDKVAKRGLDYLDYRLSYQEVRVFFEQARLHKSAEFEDHDKRNYTLVYNGDATYTVSTRKKSGGGLFGWF